MSNTDTVENFKKYMQENRDKILEHTVRLRDLPADDDWFQEDEWDEIYEQEVLKKYDNGKL